jgi:hypothetical protein
VEDELKTSELRFLGFLFILLLFSPSSFAAKAKKPIKKPVATCTVDGHGPYEDSRAACIKLGQEQARTNCALQSLTSNIPLEWRPSPKRKRTYNWICRGVWEPKIGDCLPSICRSVQKK